MPVLQSGQSSPTGFPVNPSALLGAADGAATVRTREPSSSAMAGRDVISRRAGGDSESGKVEYQRSHDEPGPAGTDDALTGVTPAERSEQINRVVNVLIAGVALLVLAPICVLVAICIKLTSPGPVFYTQTRVGLDRRWRRTPTPGADDERRLEDLGGQPFTILKFRSMRVDAEANGQAVWATKHDSRITPIGSVLRKSRLDEIPQLINVLRGEMNIVGPRPERPSIVLRLCEHVGEYPQRHRVKPGITGWAQINHSYDSSIEDVRTKVRYDLEYIGRQGLWFDVKIMCLTLPVMVFKRGAH